MDRMSTDTLAKELPADLAGWQQLASDILVEKGDIAVKDGKPLYFAWCFGLAVREYERHGRRVYRKIAVARQGDLDHKTFPPVIGGIIPHGLGNEPCAPSPILPADAAARKRIPLARGVLDYFPDALIAVAECSMAGNSQHHDGSSLHWDKSKSSDEADALMRHLIERGKFDRDGIRHSAKVCWRACALLQREIEADRARQTNPR